LRRGGHKCGDDYINIPKAKIISKQLDRREYISQTSCGICGKHLVEELRQILLPVEKKIAVDAKKGLHALKTSINTSR
jgi:FdhD protein